MSNTQKLKQYLTQDGLQYYHNRLMGVIDNIGNSTIGVGDGVTDDTDAVTEALNKSNTTVNGGMAKHKVLIVRIENQENLTIRDFVFIKGIHVVVSNCKNVKFINCSFIDFYDNDVINADVQGLIIGDEKGKDETKCCYDITLDNCFFYGTCNLHQDHKYTNGVQVPGSITHYTTGMAISLRGVVGLFIRGCQFEQNRGNGAIQANHAMPLGEFELTDNLFYLNCWGGFEIYRFKGVNPKVVNKITNNRFIGCGLGYLPMDYIRDTIAESKRGVGCAVVFGGSKHAFPKLHTLVDGNIFIDNVESSVEGCCWNPITNNYIYNQGVLQTQDSVDEMVAKYGITYPVIVRKNPSQNTIYQSHYDYDGGVNYEAENPIVIKNNIMGRFDGTNNPILMRGTYRAPLIFEDNIFYSENEAQYAHFLTCNFLKGIHWKGNRGLKPYFNQCTFHGDVELDAVKDVYKSDLTDTTVNIDLKSEDFMKETFTTVGDSAILRDNSVTSTNSLHKIVLEGLNNPIPAEDTDIKVVAYPNDYLSCSITEDKELEASETYDSNFAPFNTDKSWTMMLEVTPTSTGTSDKNKMTLFSYKNGTSVIDLYSAWNPSSVYMTNTSTNKGQQVNSKTSGDGILNPSRGGMFYALRYNKDNTEAPFTLNFISKSKLSATEEFKLSAFDYSGNVPPVEIPSSNDTTFIFGNIGGSGYTPFEGTLNKVLFYERALTDTEVSNFFQSIPSSAVDPSVVYDISTDSRYNHTDGYLYLDGTSVIDTGVSLFSDPSAKWTLRVKFQMDATESVYSNFDHIPIVGGMFMDTGDNYRKDSPGISIGMSIQKSGSTSNTLKGGFLTFRHDWRYSNSAVLTSGSEYYDLHKIPYEYIIVKDSDGISIYNDSLILLKNIPLSERDTSTAFNDTLKIGGELNYQSLENSHTFKGKIMKFLVNNRALNKEELEVFYPNIYDNEAYEKGAVTYYISNKKYDNKLIRYVQFEMLFDNVDGDGNQVALLDKEIGILFDGDRDVHWLPAGGTRHYKELVRMTSTAKDITPYSDYKILISKSAINYNHTFTIKGISVQALSRNDEYTETIGLTDFDVEWDIEDPKNLSVTEGSTLSGTVVCYPIDTTEFSTITVSSNDPDVCTVELVNTDLVATGVSEGSAIITIATANKKISQTFNIDVLSATT